MCRLLGKAILDKSHAKQATKMKVIELLICRDWVGLIKDYFEMIFDAVLSVSHAWQLKYMKDSCENMFKALEVLRYPIRQMPPDVALKIYDVFYTVVCETLNHEVILEVASTPPNPIQYTMMSSLISTLQDFVLVPEIREHRLSHSVRTALEKLINKYVDLLGDAPLAPICHRALSYLVDDESTFSQLPINYLLAGKPTNANVDGYIEDVLYVVKRLSSVSVQTHIKHPWRYQFDFRSVEVVCAIL